MPERERRLAAIMFTDIEGYTARMGADESRAIAAVQRSRTEQRRMVEASRGRWVQEVGDGALCTFVSTVDAVNCALEIQRPASVLRGVLFRAVQHRALYRL